MNFKKNIHYFTQTDLCKNLGIALMAVGLLLLVFGWSYLSFILMTVSIPTGLILFLVGSSRRSSEKDLDAAIERATAELEPVEEEAEKLNRRALKKIAPILAGGYELREGLMLKKDKSGKMRSSKYTKSYLMPLSDALYVSTRTVSLVEDQKKDLSLQIPYREIESITLVRTERELSFQKKLLRVKECRFSVTYHTGEVFSLPIQDDVLTEQFTEDLQACVKQANLPDN